VKLALFHRSPGAVEEISMGAQGWDTHLERLAEFYMAPLLQPIRLSIWYRQRPGIRCKEKSYLLSGFEMHQGEK